MTILCCVIYPCVNATLSTEKHIISLCLKAGGEAFMKVPLNGL